MCAERLQEYFHAGKILAVWLVIEEDACCVGKRVNCVSVVSLLKHLPSCTGGQLVCWCHVWWWCPALAVRSASSTEAGTALGSGRHGTK